MPRGSGPELENTASSFDFALLDRRIPERVYIGEVEPAGGWTPSRLEVHTDQTQAVRVENNSTSATLP